MIICGIELKANNTILSIIQTDEQKVIYVNNKVKKLTLDDDENKSSLLKYQDKLDQFLEENKVEKVALKKRAKKGTFAGGSVTFKVETMIQLNTVCDVELVTSQAISKYTKKNEVIIPEKLNKYQEQAYFSSLLLV